MHTIINVAPDDDESTCNIYSKTCTFLLLRNVNIEVHRKSVYSLQYLNSNEYNAMQCNAMQCNAMQCNAMQYNRFVSTSMDVSNYYTLNGK